MKATLRHTTILLSLWVGISLIVHIVTTDGSQFWAAAGAGVALSVGVQLLDHQ